MEVAQTSPAGVDAYPPPGALAEMVAVQKSNVCFIDVGDADRAAPLIAEAASLSPPIPVVAVDSGNHPDVILRCLRQGASEFLSLPLEVPQVREALDRLERLRRDSRGYSGKAYCVMPGKGACGASTLASNLAVNLKRLGTQKVLLVDLDPLTGTASFLLKLKSNYSFVDAMAHAADMDEDIWKGLVTPCQGFDVLLPPENPIDAFAEAGSPASLIEYARSLYEIVVVDTQRPYGDWGLSVARTCDEVLLVTTNELPALHCTRKAMAYLDQNGIDRMKIKLIVNRYSPQAGLSREAIETALHADVFHVLPSDYEAVQRALMDGKPVPAGTALGKSIATLSEQLTGRELKPKKGSLFGGLLSLFDSVTS